MIFIRIGNAPPRRIDTREMKRVVDDKAVVKALEESAWARGMREAEENNESTR